MSPLSIKRLIFTPPLFILVEITRICSSSICWYLFLKSMKEGVDKWTFMGLGLGLLVNAALAFLSFFTKGIFSNFFTRIFKCFDNKEWILILLTIIDIVVTGIDIGISFVSLFNDFFDNNPCAKLWIMDYCIVMALIAIPVELHALKQINESDFKPFGIVLAVVYLILGLIFIIKGATMDNDEVFKF